MDEIIKDILIVIWLILTFIFFRWACKSFHVISFSGAKGFFDGYFGMLIYSGIGAGIIVGLAVMALDYFLDVISNHLLIFFLIDAVLIGGTVYAVKKGNTGISKIWMAVLAVFTVVIVACGVISLMHPKTEKTVPVNNTKQVQRTETNQNASKTKTSEQSNSTQSSSKSLASYRNDKDTFDNQIVKFSEKINGHLQQSPNFKNTSYDNEGRQILQNIKKDRDNLSKDSNIAKSNGAEQKALLHLYDLEITRIQGMIDGITASKNGRDFTPGFRSGTSAAYEFDDANAAYKKDFK